jgi:hypothetical protein
MLRPTDSSTSLQPFVELLGTDRQVMGPTGYRFGYRNPATGEAVCTVDVPAATVEQALMSQLSLSVTMSADGKITAHFLEPDDVVAAGVAAISRSIDDMVAQGTSPDELSRENPSASDLKSLLARLEHSVALVRAALVRVELEDGD